MGFWLGLFTISMGTKTSYITAMKMTVIQFTNHSGIQKGSFVKNSKKVKERECRQEQQLIQLVQPLEKVQQQQQAFWGKS